MPAKFDINNMNSVSDLLELTPEYVKDQLEQSWVKPELFVPLKKYPLSKNNMVEELLEFQEF